MDNDVILCGIFGVKDLKADSITFVYTEKSPHAAMRSFGLNARKDTVLAQFPDDFALIHLGWISQDGFVRGFEKPVQLCTARDYVNPPMVGQSVPAVDDKEQE